MDEPTTFELDGPVLLYDGLCGFCDWAVRWVLRADRRAVFRFAPLQGTFAADTLARHPGLEGTDSLFLVEVDHAAQTSTSERVSVRSVALLRTVSLLGGFWRFLLVAWLVPRPIRDWVYDVFARHRYRLFGRYEACPVPPIEVRERFVD